MQSNGIHKTLKIVRDNGIGAEIDFGYRVRRFKCKNGCEHHNHMVCALCGNYLYIDNKNLEDLQDGLCKENGFIPNKHDFKIFGVCQACEG